MSTPKEHRAMLQGGAEADMEMFGYRTHLMRWAVFVLGYVLSCGVLLLVFYWKPEWYVWANCLPCSLQEADVILLQTADDFKKYTKKKVKWIHLTTSASALTPEIPIIADEDSIINRVIQKPELKVRYIEVQKIKYAWVNSEKHFQKVGELEDAVSSSELHRKYGSGLTSEEQDIRRIICGPNTIEIEVPPIWKLFVKEVLNLLYVHQFVTLTLWLYEGYVEFSTVLLLISFISICFTLYELRQQSLRLHSLVEAHNNVCVTVCRRNGDYKDMESRYLVPGDVLILTGKKLYLPCDAILISGSCVTNEGMLTGESTPVTKTPLPSADTSMPWKSQCAEDYKRHVLFCGTEVIQSKADGHGPVKAIVLRTGFNTAKGDLVRSILYPKPMNFKLHRDAVRFFMFIVFLGLVGTMYTVAVAAEDKAPLHRILMEAFLVLSSAFSPAIPAALATGMITAHRRLKKKSIFCISPQRINVCGQINLICFDKTGTLTEDGMDLWGIVPAKENCFQKVQKFYPETRLSWGPLLGAMASCHSLITLDGELEGDPLDQKMFRASGWEIEDSVSTCKNGAVSAGRMTLRPGPEVASTIPVPGIIIVHQYPFSSMLQRMCVITQVIGHRDLDIYMKGAPEKVASFCRKGTVPTSFSEELEVYTFQGFRVIGLAHKTLAAQDATCLNREEVESDLEFLGLLILENRLKKETKAVMQEFNAATIRTVMVTGDNLQTAITVARYSAMIPSSSRVILVEARGPDGDRPASVSWHELEENKPNGHEELKIDVVGGASVPEVMGGYHFAMDGSSYHIILQHFYSLLQRLLINGTVFARMAPVQKSSLIEEFQKMDYMVAMCGDGANDCGALKLAHAGISLSGQEASVASPFTSKTDNIECVAELIKEGRAALVTSFCLFKYIALYGLIVYISLMILYWQRNFFSNYQFLIQDLAITLPVFLTMSLNAAAPKLAPYRPAAQLFSPPMLLSVVFNVVFSLAIQMYAVFVVQKQTWYSASGPHSACMTSAENMTFPVVSTGMILAPNGTIAHAPNGHESFENTTLWLLTTGSLVIFAFVFSKGRPFRQPMFTNYPFLFVLLAYAGLSIFFICADIASVYNVMELVCTPTRWRVHIVIILIINLAVTLVVEEAFLENRAIWTWLKTRGPLQQQSLYKTLRHILEGQTEWPPSNRSLYPSSVSMHIDEGPDACWGPADVHPGRDLSGEQEKAKPAGGCMNGQPC